MTKLHGFSSLADAGLHGKRGLLAIAHPGHELRVFGWMTMARPRVLVLTDGSGSNRTSRLEPSRKVIESCGGTPTSLFGLFTDRQLYDLILNGLFRTTELYQLLERIVDELIDWQIDYVVGDAVEGINTGHDVLRELVNVAVVMASSRKGKAIMNFDFPLYARPDEHAKRNFDVTMQLTAELFTRKLAVANSYLELRDEVEAAITRFGTQAFANEQLRRVFATNVSEPPEQPPYYERYGAERVELELYSKVIRYSHVRSVGKDLWQYAKQTIAGLPEYG